MKPSGIDIAFWFMQDTSIANKVIARYQAGVPVRILVDPRANPTYAGNEQILNQFKAAGIPMRYKNGGGILHWKMMLFVGQNKLEFSGANYRPEFLCLRRRPTRTTSTKPSTSPDDQSLINSFKTKYDDLWTDTVNYSDYAKHHRTADAQVSDVCDQSGAEFSTQPRRQPGLLQPHCS